MSLDWNTKSVQYFKDHPDELWIKIKTDMQEYDDVNAETKSLIFGSMAVGIGVFSPKYLPEWYARWKMYEKYDDFYLYRVFEEGDNVGCKVFLTPEILIKHTNMVTNVSYQNATDWCKRFVKQSGYRSENRPTLAQAKSLLTVYKMEFNEHYEMVQSV